MCQNCCKIKTYVGFAKKSRKIILGADDIIKAIKVAKLIIVSDSLSSSSLDKLSKAAKKYHIDIFTLKEDEFFNLIDSVFIKAIAITDKNLSDAIKIQLDK